MKITILGGAGVRVPLLVGGLMRSDLPIDQIDLYDADQERLPIVCDLASRMVDHPVSIRARSEPEPSIAGANYVIASIRVGGVARRARDEAIAIAHGVVGQETIGPAGFAMALRTIPAMVEYGRLVSRLAPGAWLISFTNPVSIVTQAVHQESGARVIGICDTPTEIFEDAAHALDLPARECAYDYFGLNHLGWLREVYHAGTPHLHRLWEDAARLAAVYRTPLFEAERLRALRLLPTEYVYYYYRPEVALAHLRRAGTSRGAVVSALTDALFVDLAKAGRALDTVRRYQQYLAARDAGYMQLESGGSTPRVKPDWAELSGYDRIALMTMRAIVHDTRDVIPLDLPNAGNLPFLEDDDIIEVPALVDANGPRALHVRTVPDHCRDLIERVKIYERATIRAALSGDPAARVDALALNPLVPSRAHAEALVAAFGEPS
jgi:6-phospho-beta-glucosidase